jgi:PrtD family type I secretion system ABC transporter
MLELMTQKADHILWSELRQFSPAFAGLAFFSFILTLMYLVPAIFMHQLFERVFQSRSIETLMVLVGVVIFLCIIWTVIETLRSRVLQRMSVALHDRIAVRVFDALNRQSDGLPAASRNVVMQDLQTLREFLSGASLAQALDFIWVPIILGVTFLYHPLLGVTLTGLTVLVVILAVANQLLVRGDMTRSIQSANRASEFGRAVMASAESARVMGTLPALVRGWHGRQQTALGWQDAAVRRSGLVGGTIKFARHVYSPIMLTVGTLLFLDAQVGPGIIFAASVLTTRAIFPVDGLASNWRQFWSFRVAMGRIEAILREAGKRTSKVSLPAPDGPLVVSRVVAGPRHRDTPILTDVSFTVPPGRVVGVVGASGSGKSALARVLVGAWDVRGGSVSLGGHELSHWDQDELGCHIGYVPQDVDLMPGTVADNIARFEDASDERDARLVDAANLASIQDIIQRLPDGFNTKLGPDGHTLSGGQRQRIALARAVYREPRLLVLDEPNSNLDAAGEESLGRTIGTMRDRGAIVVIVTHRMNILTLCDQIVVMNGGTVHVAGPREQVLERLASAIPARQLTLAPGGAQAAA